MTLKHQKQPTSLSDEDVVAFSIPRRVYERYWVPKGARYARGEFSRFEGRTYYGIEPRVRTTKIIELLRQERITNLPPGFWKLAASAQLDWIADHILAKWWRKQDKIEVGHNHYFHSISQIKHRVTHQVLMGEMDQLPDHIVEWDRLHSGTDRRYYNSFLPYAPGVNPHDKIW